MSADQPAYDRFVTALEVQSGPGRNGSWRCPAHEDSTPSLSVTDTGGKVLVTCHAGCRTEEVVAALGLTMGDLFDAPPEKTNGKKVIAATYDYVDEDGVLLSQAVRYSPKAFSQRRPNGRGGWEWKLGDTRRVLYGLPQVLEAKANGTSIFLTEGEKDADALIRAGEVATTNPMGAGKWRPEYVRQLEGAAEVIIVRDRDDPGRQHAEAVRRSLLGKVGAIHVVEPVVGKDAADHLAAGRTVDDFEVVASHIAEAAKVEIGESEGRNLLDDVRDFIARFVAFPSPAALNAVALWVAHAHLVEGGENSPRLALLSPEPGSGKTRTLEVLELLVPAPMFALSASTAATFRSLAKEQRTLLFDEVDAIFGRHGKDDPAEDLRALLNAGHRKGATIPRCVGAQHDVADFPVFAATALAGLGDLPDTLMSRSVIVRMRKRSPSEHIEPFRRRLHLPGGTALRDRLAAWCAAVGDRITDAWPEMPDGVADRPADVWEPLLAIADEAGGHWPDTGRSACTALVKVAESREASLGVKLLADLRGVFAETEALSTETILAKLHELDESPWADLRGKALDARGLARRLRQYEITSTKVKVDGKALQGYRREHLWDAFVRYLPPNPESPEPVEPVELPMSGGMAEVPLAIEVPEPGQRTEPFDWPSTRHVPEVPEVLLSGGLGAGDVPQWTDEELESWTAAEEAL